jgi:hypothetical protein
VSVSNAKLADLTGTNARTVRRSLESLADAGWISITPQPGKPAEIAFHNPTDPGQNVQGETDDNPGQNVRGSPDRNPGQNVQPPTLDNMSATPDNLSDTLDILSDPSFRETTSSHLPQKAGDFVNGSRAENGTLDEAVECIGKAYREITGSTMPAAWRDKIEKEFSTGDAEALFCIDAKTLKNAKQSAEAAGMGFYFTNVITYIHRKQAAAYEARQARDQAKADANAATTAQETAIAAETALLETFRNRSPKDQTRWIATAKKKNKRMTNPKIIEQMAAHLAAESYDSQTLEITA